MSFWSSVINSLLFIWKTFSFISMFGIFWFVFTIPLYFESETKHFWYILVDLILVVNYLIVGTTGITFFTEDPNYIFGPLFTIGVIIIINKLFLIIRLYRKKRVLDTRCNKKEEI